MYVTSYGYDPETGSIVAVWHTPAGPRARTITGPPNSGSEAVLFALAGGLTSLSKEASGTFTRPATAAGDADETNSEAWRRQYARDSFGDALEALTKPNLPSSGLLVRSYVSVLEVAHQVGRALHEPGDADLTAAVAREVSTELASVELC